MFLLRGPTLFVYLDQICSVALAVKKKAECPYFSTSKIKSFVSDTLKHSALMLLSKVFDFLLLFKENIIKH